LTVEYGEAVGITAPEIIERYPILYHMASHGSWPLIQQHGLLSSSALVDLFEVPEPRKTALLTTQRHTSEPITHPKYGTAILRDQKVLSAKSLARCLTGCTSAEWYSILNERVFFWLSHHRLITLMSAREYVRKQHTILHMNTAGIVGRYEKEIELAAMNTGNTLPFPHPRGRSTFRRLEEYDYQKRHKLNDYSAVVELTVLKGVPDVARDVIRVEHASIEGGEYVTKEVIVRK
jgi:hypothetical protein